MIQHESLIDTIINGIALLAAMLVLAIAVPLMFLIYCVIAGLIWIVGMLWRLFN
jgi:hypothetical protein